MRIFFNSYTELPKSLYLLFCVQIINRLGDFVIPFLTLLLTQKLGFSYAVTGVIVMIASLISIPAALIGGRCADQLGRKKIYLVGQGLSGVLIFICGFIKEPSFIIVLLLFSTFFNGFVRPTLSAMVADILPIEKRQQGSSLMYLGINLGVAIGPMAAGFLLNNYLTLFYVADALTSFIAVGIVLFFIKETNPLYTKETTLTDSEKVADGNLLAILLNRKEILIFLSITILYSIMYAQHKFALPMMLNNVFPNSGPSKFGLLLSVNAFTVILLSLVIVAFTKRFTPLTNIIFAGIFYTVGFGMIGIIDSFSMYMLSTVLWTIGEILMATNFGVYLVNNSPQNFRARFSAIGSLSSSIGGAIGTSLMGIYIGFSGINAVWTLTFIIGCVAVVLMTSFQFYSQKKVVKSIRCT